MSTEELGVKNKHGGEQIVYSANNGKKDFLGIGKHFCVSYFSVVCSSDADNSKSENSMKVESRLILFASHFASQMKVVQFGNYFLMCVVQIKTFWLDFKYPQQATARE